MNLITEKVLVLLLCAYYGYSQVQKFMVDVKTLGRILESETTLVSGRVFRAFRGIPFAQPSVGDMRFRVKYLFF